MKKPLAILVALVCIGAVGGTWWMTRPQAVPTPNTVPVMRGDVEKTVVASGILQANSLVSVGAEVSGRIEAVHVKLGQVVQKGDLLVEMDRLDQENAIKSAEAALAGVEAQKRSQQASLATANAALDRAQKLRTNSLLSQADLETAQAAVDAALAQIDQLDAQIAQSELAVESARLNLMRTSIVAPSAGTVVALLVEAGQTVNANQTTPTIAKIADLKTMVIKAGISEADVVRVAPGQRAYFSILGEPDARIEATLREVEPAPTSIETDTTSSETAIYYNGLFDVPNPDGKLRISMTAQVTIVLDEARDALVLPSALLTRKDPEGNGMVIVYDPQTQQSQPRRVRIGLDNNITAQVLDGLEEGEEVVSTLAGAGPRLPSSGAGTRRPPGGMGMMMGGPPP